MTNFKNKVALVTGASSGIGAAIAEQLSNQGVRVFGAQRTSSNYEDILSDLSDPKAPEEIISVIKKVTGRLDILINNAGIMTEGTVEETTLKNWNRHLSINLTAPFLLIREAMPLLREFRGSIVNLGSVEGIGNNPRHPAYGASKSGLHGLTRAVAVDHGKDGVRCNAVAPGWIDTPLNENFVKGMDDPIGFREKLSDIHPIGRSGQPSEVAELICWLVSDAASFVTGQVWTIDGGRMTKLSLP